MRRKRHGQRIAETPLKPFDMCNGSRLLTLCLQVQAIARNPTLVLDPLEDQRFPEDRQTIAGAQCCGRKPSISSLEPEIEISGGV
jgi:hypothetical protein